MNIEKKLKQMYTSRSKHSNYQVLASELEPFLNSNEVKINSRNEKIRLDYILSNVKIKDKNVLDIGGNTGYFSFELLANEAKNVTYYEGNKEHAEFVKLASKILNRDAQILIHNEYYDFKQDDKYDIVLLLNVLHHIGDDFGDDSLSKQKALAQIIEYLNNVLLQADTVVFQLGFNWKGNILLPLFESGTKKELIEFIISNLNEKFQVVKIGVAQKIGNIIKFEDVNERNIERDDSLGEFLNRPIFIIKKKNLNK
ncbi:class I SAM-dependent methyltransferase [Sulfurimonas microaerophilic]|uniref:class I SAM-dependent methyltransferase n=1 Tax=Sulfurimonas microaerophilic TaxID=3058392 RepID=UPI002714EA31|nr:class I SAM-dependent methyltransferase [Sulfurimonas sp. hsl 1-7]